MYACTYLTAHRREQNGNVHYVYKYILYVWILKQIQISYIYVSMRIMYAFRYLTAHRREPNERKTFTLKRQGPVPFIPTVKLQRCVTDSSLSPCSFTSMLMCVAVCCSVVRCDAACCSETPTVCNGQLPQFLHTHVYVTVCCSVVQCGVVWFSVVQCGAVCCSVMQCVAVCCSVLQCMWCK